MSAKSFIITLTEEGKAVEILTMRQVESSDVPYLKSEAKKNKKEIEKAKEAERLAEEAKKAEVDKEAKKKEYYSPYHIATACDSLLMDWQLGDDTIEQEAVSECKKKAIEGQEGEALINSFNQVKTRLVALFGEVE